MRPRHHTAVARRGALLLGAWALALGMLGATAPAAFAAEGECPNEARRMEQDSTHLPGCRAYELVSPPDTNGNVVFGAKLSDDGERAALYYQGGVPGSTSGGVSQLLATRTAAGWTSRNLLPPAQEIGGTSSQVIFSAPDLSAFVLLGYEFFAMPSPPIPLFRLYPSGQQEHLYTRPATGEAPMMGSLAAEDTSRVFWTLEEQLDPGHTAGTKHIYEIGDGTPNLVSLLPGDAVPLCGILDNGAQSFLGQDSTAQHRVSVDGERLFFHSAGNGPCDGPGMAVDLYMREGGGAGEGTTKLISGPPLSGDDDGATFLQATPDGSKAFYITSTVLDADDVNSTLDVYAYTAGAGNECLTCVVPNAEVEHSSSLVPAIAERDGAYVYFNSLTQLVPGEGTPGARNLYVLHEGELDYVSPSDGVTQNPSNSDNASALTPDGTVLFFRSDDPGLDAVTGSSNGGLFQYYRYDAIDHSLVCISCPSAGAASKSVPRSMLNPVRLYSQDDARPINEDGSIFVFKTFDGLVPEDVNGAEDIYQWHDGALGLITSGEVSYPNTFADVQHRPEIVGVSATGRDVLFVAFESLTPEVLHAQPPGQLYDARIGGGFPPPTAFEPLCDGEACLPPPAPYRPALGAGSDAFRGEGNLSATRPRGGRCPRGKHKVRRGGKARCVVTAKKRARPAENGRRASR